MPISQIKIDAIRLVGGVAVLDFLNSCNGRRPGTTLDEVVDSLLSLEDVVYWFHHAQVISSEELAQFLTLLPTWPSTHIHAFEQLISFREGLYQLFFPIAEGRRMTAASLQFLNNALVDTAPQRQLASVGHAAVWSWRHCNSIDEMTASMIGRLTVQAASLLTSPDLARLKICSTQACDWLFVDTSKNGRRRWCQMNICGSREKAKKALSVHDH
ncbi:CGNR zinc finger domain-containing protein [Pseudomonas sp. NA-150]|uniref:CGNR zinc finger domain-containing protein n=1 Tax=Pseudomonas sp. NA-150 TaxID=3367525 RepID=UPI0037C8F750